MQRQSAAAVPGHDHNKRWLTENEVMDAPGRAIIDGLTPLRPLQQLNSVGLSEAAIAAKAEDQDQYETGALHVLAMLPECNDPPPPLLLAMNSLPSTGLDRPFPCLLLDFCGPLLSVFGIVNTSDQDAVCEPLTLSVPLLFFDNESMMVSLARVCGALKRAVQELTEQETGHFHQKTSSRGHGPPADRIRWRFPYKDSIQLDNGETISFQYLQAIQKYVFVANIPKDDGTKPVIVKFAKRLCAGAAGLASVAQWVDGVVLIDFDWAGQDHVATYPPFINSEITWPPGAECGEPLRLAHDAHWLDSLVRWHARE